MLFKDHQASYELGERLLRPEERMVVTSRFGPQEAQWVAEYLGLDEEHPEEIIKHIHHSDEEYTPEFLTKNCLTIEEFSNYCSNYLDENGKHIYGQGLKNRTLYLVHTNNSNSKYNPQALSHINKKIAATAKYLGAEAVVLIAYTLNYSAQERGVHDEDHQRMKSEEAKLKFDGQAPLAGFELMDYAMNGIDAIVTPHNHAPRDLERLCTEVNKRLAPLSRVGSNWRYHLKFIEIDLAPLIGEYVSNLGAKNLEFDLSDGGRNVLFMGPDVGARDLATKVRVNSGLENSSLAVMNKKKSKDNTKISVLELNHSINLTDERGIEGMQVFLVDDCIRTAMTMQKNIQVLSGMNIEGIVRDPKIKGVPAKVVPYATRTNFAGASTKILSTPFIDQVVITNADPRALRNTGPIDNRTQVIWLDGLMAEAVKTVEQGIDPNTILTPHHIRKNKLLNVQLPRGHKLKKRKKGII